MRLKKVANNSKYRAKMLIFSYLFVKKVFTSYIPLILIFNNY